LFDAVVADDEGVRVERAEAAEEAAVGDNAAPALAGAGGTDELERRVEAEEY
jgi:hypothetical protein